jgi:hypothetical protein
MASTINASTSSGLVNTADTSGVLQLQTANTTALSISASQIVSTTNDATISGLTVGRGSNGVSNNTAIGKSALPNASLSGDYNVAVGLQAGNSLTSGQRNTLIGTTAGSSLTTGSYNTFVGCLDSTGGGAAGAAITTGTNNSILGNYTGNQDGLDIRTSNKYIVISDGVGYRHLSMYDGGTVALASAVPVAGTGITFPATQNASSNANTLDDYEEGTWTPTATRFGTAPTGVTYSDRIGTYTKIGNVVTAYFDFTISSISTAGSSQNAITGLPFSAEGSVFPVPNYRACNAVPAGPTATTRLAGYVAGTAIYLETDNIGNAGFGTNGIVNGNWATARASGWVTYRVA